jgi:hypothetical protein
MPHLNAFNVKKEVILFGLSKKEKFKKYEHKIIVFLHALFGETNANDEDRETWVTPKIKEVIGPNWVAILESSIESGNSPEATALAIAVTFYQIILNNTNVTELVKMRKCILERNYSDSPLIFVKIIFTDLVANGWASGNEKHENLYTLALRDIHRAIFDGSDEYLNETIYYFMDAAERARTDYKHKLNVVEAHLPLLTQALQENRFDQVIDQILKDNK